jgi:cytochrome c5/Ca2+-binding RTX toxin-like protein
MTANITYYGITNDFFQLAFDDIAVAASSSTSITLVDQISGYRTVLTGLNFSGDIENGVLNGTLTAMQISDSSSNPVVSLDGVSWNAQQFVDAIIELLNDPNQDSAGLTALFSLQPINFDGSAADIGADIFFDGVSQPVTMLGGNYRDTLSGGDGNDTINPGNSAEFEGDVIFGSLGSDRIDLANLQQNRWFELSYEEFNTPVTVNFDGNAGTASVNKGAGQTDTVVNAANVLTYGIGIYGGRGNDTFTGTSGGGNFVSLSGMEGNDTFNLTLDGTVRLDYRGGWVDGPSTGITANLAAGTVSNDGFGGTDTINILGGDGTFEMRGTDFNDNIIGSANNERFILRLGNDTLDAGGGFDTLRYDRNGVESINVDLTQGQVSGRWHGTDFLHSISGVEEIRGSRSGADTMVGDESDNMLRAYDGDDILIGNGGTDFLYGGGGNDTLDPGDNNNFDYVDAGAGIDQVQAGGVLEGYLEVGHYDLRNSTSMTVNFEMDNNPNQLDDATVSKGSFGTTTVLAASTAFQADGIAFSGGDLNDTFNTTLTERGWVGFRGGRGDDTYSINNTGDGQNAIVRLNFDKGIDNRDTPDQGLNVDLATGIIANDGFGGQDAIIGNYDLQLEIRGTDNADMISGSHRDERFIGRAGNDTIDGKGGYDLIRFDRTDVDSGVRVDLGMGTATGSFSGSAFTYTLANIEAVNGSVYNDILKGSNGGETFAARDGDDLIFGDGASASYFGSSVANQVYRLYQATLDRAPDVTGHSNWSERIATGERTLLEVAEGFVGSPEFTATYSANLTNSQFVTLLYNNVLNSNPDDRGLARWTGDLEAGASRAEVVLGFSQSPQFINETTLQANAYANASLASNWSDDVFRLYQATLDRVPDVQGQTNWSQRLADGVQTLEQVAQGFVGSQEFQNIYGGADNDQFVTLLYNNVLGITPDDKGFARWTGELESGASRAEVVLGFSQSPQFMSETAADVKTWMRTQDVHDTIVAGTGDNIVAGGQFADVFVFAADQESRTIIRDFEAWDGLQLTGFGYTDLAQVKGQMSQSGSDVIFSDRNVEVVLEDTVLADIVNDTFVDTFVIV